MDPFIVGDVAALKIVCAWLLRALETYVPAEAAARAETMELLLNTAQTFPLDGLTIEQAALVRGRIETTLHQLLTVGFQPAPPAPPDFPQS